MKKILLAAAIVVLFSNKAFSQGIETASMKAVAKEISTSSNSTQLDLKLTLTFDKKPNKECTVRYFLVVSDVGVPDSETKKRNFLTQTIKKGSGKRINLSYKGAAIDGDEGDQRQGNFAATIRCGDEDVVESTVAAANLTCGGGLSVNQFVKALRARLN